MQPITSGARLPSSKQPRIGNLDYVIEGEREPVEVSKISISPEQSHQRSDQTDSAVKSSDADVAAGDIVKDKAKSSVVEQATRKPVTVIEGEKGVIRVDGRIAQSNDKVFKNQRLVSVRVARGLMFINGKLVFNGKSIRPDNFSTATMISLIAVALK
ncbi:hypothetical protein U1Q18_049623 [Sarracenia purpurea var. burkii]